MGLLLTATTTRKNLQFVVENDGKKMYKPSSAKAKKFPAMSLFLSQD